MHALSLASAVAIARLVGGSAIEELIDEAAEYVECARFNLALDNISIVAAMMFAQPLLNLWKPHWKFAYTVGLSMGVKFTTEGFFLADITEHLTDEFPIALLEEGEGTALEIFDWTALSSRL